MRRTLLTLAMSCVLAAPAAAQQLTLTFNNGLVTVDAASVPVRTILNEWAKRGGTKVVGAERIGGAPLTVKLIDVTEAQALEVILRSVAGYMAAPRSTGRRRVECTTAFSSWRPAPLRRRPRGAAHAGESQRDVGHAAIRAAAAAARPKTTRGREEDDPNPPNPPVFTFPGAPGQNGQPGAFVQHATTGRVNAQPVNPQPMIVNPQTGQPQTDHHQSGDRTRRLSDRSAVWFAPHRAPSTSLSCSPAQVVRPPGRQQQ